MSKVSIAAATALLIGSMAPVWAHAQSDGYLVPDRQLPTQPKHPKARVPVNARGSATEPGGIPTPAVHPGGRWFETDPDPRIRFEMNRDDRDRRVGN
jgi:hypothetical protein